MKRHITLGVLALGSALGLLSAQAPDGPMGWGPGGPLPMGGTETTVSGAIAQLNYDHEGRVEGFLLSPNTLVLLPPEWAVQLEATAQAGEQVKVTGLSNPAPSGMKIIRPESLAIGGKTLALLKPNEPAPYTGSGAIRQLNYGARGEVDGFLLENGVLGQTPPFGAIDASILKPGATISIAGFARQTPAGKTVVEVQSITANGQTITLERPERRGPGAFGGPGGGPGAPGCGLGAPGGAGTGPMGNHSRHAGGMMPPQFPGGGPGTMGEGAPPPPDGQPESSEGPAK